jgi:N-acetylmuramoyl-L-alanine amidase
VKLFISAGHNPQKPGACHEGFCEHDEAVRWQKLLYEKLHNDIWTFKVPTGTITYKTDYINIRANPSDIAMEIHFNSSAMAYHKKVEGAETLYYPGSIRGKKVAQLIQEGMLSGCPTLKDRGIKEGWYQQDKKKGTIFLLRKTTCTALILEPEFIQNKQKIKDIREDVCAGIANALLNNSL